MDRLVGVDNLDENNALETAGLSFASEYLVEMGLLNFYNERDRTIDNSHYSFTHGVFSEEIDNLFIEYAKKVNLHEDARSASAEVGYADNVMLSALDQSRSLRHDALAKRLQAELDLEHWGHEKMRQLVSAMIKPLVNLWIETSTLEPTPDDIEDIAEAVLELSE